MPSSVRLSCGRSSCRIRPSTNLRGDIVQRNTGALHARPELVSDRSRLSSSGSVHWVPLLRACSAQRSMPTRGIERQVPLRQKRLHPVLFGYRADCAPIAAASYSAGLLLNRRGNTLELMLCPTTATPSDRSSDNAGARQATEQSPGGGLRQGHADRLPP